MKEGKSLPDNPLFKIQFDGAGRNPYSNKVVVLDEIHNLVRPTQCLRRVEVPAAASAANLLRYRQQLQALRDMLMTARRTALLGTPPWSRI